MHGKYFTFSAAYCILVLCSVQHIGLLPVFQRFDYGDFSDSNENYIGYWEENKVVASTDDDVSDSTLTERFDMILEWLIQSKLESVYSLSNTEMEQ